MTNSRLDKKAMPKDGETEGKVITLEEAMESLTDRQQKLIHVLPKHNWIWAQAGPEAGFSKSYSRQHLKTDLMRNNRFSQALALKKRQIQAESGWDDAKWRQEQQAVIDASKAAGDRATWQAGVVSMGKHIGVFEADNRQRQGQIGILINGQVDAEGD